MPLHRRKDLLNFHQHVSHMSELGADYKATDSDARSLEQECERIAG